MEISDNNETEITRVIKVIKDLDGYDQEKFIQESDNIFKHQPFLLSLILGYHADLKEQELEEVTKVIFIIWCYFKDKDSVVVKQKKVTEAQFERLHHRNLHFLQYFQNESKHQKSRLVEEQFSHLSSKALMAEIFLRFNTHKILLTMAVKTRGIVLIGMKTLIECFEEAS